MLLGYWVFWWLLKLGTLSKCFTSFMLIPTLLPAGSTVSLYLFPTHRGQTVN
jgi:hypothetical protein